LVADFHTYFAGREDVWVHNCNCGVSVTTVVDADSTGPVYKANIKQSVDTSKLNVDKTNATSGVETPHTINTGGKHPKTSEPNSIIESQRADGSSSVTYYNEQGKAFSREDYGQQSTHGSLGQRADGRSVAHEHRFDYNDRGFPIKQDVYRELTENGVPAGPWVGEK